MSLGDQAHLSSGLGKEKPLIEMSTVPRITIAKQNQKPKKICLQVHPSIKWK